MSNNDLLSAWNPEFDADILDSTEYLRHELARSLRQISNECTPLRITQDLIEGLDAYAPNIDPFTWVLHEPETLGELYRAQEQEGANVAVAQSASCMSEAENTQQAKTALTHALKEAEGNNAIWFLADLDVHCLNEIDLESEDEVRKAKLILLEQLRAFDEFGAHGAWICINRLDTFDIILEALRLEGHLPAVFSMKSPEVFHVNPDKIRQNGLTIRFNSLIEVLDSLEDLVSLQEATNTHLIIEFDSFGMSEETAYESLEILKQHGIRNFRPGVTMTRKERVLLYSFV